MVGKGTGVAAYGGMMYEIDLYRYDDVEEDVLKWDGGDDVEESQCANEELLNHHDLTTHW